MLRIPNTHRGWLCASPFAHLQLRDMMVSPRKHCNVGVTTLLLTYNWEIWW